MLRDRIEAYYGGGCDILATRRTAGGDAFWFVVDASSRSRLLRTLGSIDRGGSVMEQSAMDLLQPERLVFLYERVMLLAFALVPTPRRALLLGLGGGAMCRHLAAYVPECAVTVVERDRGVLDMARKYFRLTQSVIEGDAEDVVADAAGAFDVVLVDLYDSRGLFPVQESFWRDCAAALCPNGCLAINWAGFLNRHHVQDEIERAGAVLGPSFFIADRGVRPNMVQLVPKATGFRLEDLTDRLRGFAKGRRLPTEDRNSLQRCQLYTRFPQLPLYRR